MSLKQKISFNIISIIGAVLLLSPYNIISQDKSEIVAKAGNVSISLEEFHRRYEFTPHPQNSSDSKIINTKQEFLLTLIAEKLLAQEALNQGFNQDEELISMMDYLKGVYLRDALYKIEIKDKVVVPDSLLNIGRDRIQKTIKSKFVFSEEKNEIDSIFALLTGGADFDSILSNREESTEQLEIKPVTFGGMHPLIEDDIFELLPGYITKPIQLKEGWYIFKVYDVSIKNHLNEEDESKVKRIVSKRIEDNLYEKFYSEFFKGITINADRVVFEILTNAILSYIIDNEKSFSTNSRFKFRLGESEFRDIIKSLENELSKIFIKFENDPITLKDFLFNLMFAGINFNSSERTHIQKVLSSTVFNSIQNELLIREASKRGYGKLPDVQKDLKAWYDYYLAQRIMKKLFLNKTVTDKEALDFYNKENKIVQMPDSVKIVELLTDDLEMIEEVLTKINQGEDFKTLVMKYDSKSSNHKNGVSDYFPVTERGNIGKIASQLKINEIYGPIKLAEGYGIIQLLDKREGIKRKIALFDDAKEDIKKILRTEKMLNISDSLTVRLASETKLEINYDVLSKLKVTDVNMIVLRRFGFGGQLLAVPYSQPYTSWYNLYLQELKNNLP